MRIPAASIRAMSRMSWNKRVSRSSSIIAALACARRCSTGSSSRRFSTAARIAVSGVLKSAERCERRRQAGLWRTSSRYRAYERTLDRNRDDAAGRVQGADIKRRRGRREETDRLGALTQGDNRDLVVRPDAEVPAVRTLMGIEFERAARFRQRRIQDIFVNVDFFAAALINLPAVVARDADRHPRQLEAPGNVACQGVDRAARFGCQQYVTCEIEQARHHICAVRPPRVWSAPRR